MSYQVPTGVNAGAAGLPAAGLVIGVTYSLILAFVVLAIGLALLALTYYRREDIGA